MKVVFISIGKSIEKEYSTLIEAYQNRIAHYLKYDTKHLKGPRSADSRLLREQEGALVLNQIQAGDFVVLLDERGKAFNSEGFAGWIASKQSAGIRNLVFVCGGAYGFSEPLRARADFTIRLSDLTFPHQMVRLIFTEQLYRALSILAGSGYHHD